MYAIIITDAGINKGKLQHLTLDTGSISLCIYAKIQLCWCFQMQQPGKTEQNTLEPISQSHIVELSVVAPLGQDSIGDDMKNFAEQLKPYPLNHAGVTLTGVDLHHLAHTFRQIAL